METSDQKGVRDIYIPQKLIVLLTVMRATLVPFRMKDIFDHQDIKLHLARHKLSDQMDMMREGNDALLERIVSKNAVK